MFSRISRALLPIGQAVQEARSSLRTNAVPDSSRGVLGALSDLSSLTARSAAGFARSQRIAPSLPFQQAPRPGPRAFGTIPVAKLPTAWKAAALQGTPRRFADVRPPSNEIEEQAQWHLALEQSRTESFLRDLPRVREHFDAASIVEGNGITDWDDLAPDIRQLYSSKLEYYQEASSAQMRTPRIDQALKRAGMQAIPNDGMTIGGRNNCLLIALLQHATGDYRVSHSALVDQYRDILRSAPQLELAANEKISTGSHAARALVDLINSDPDVQPKLHVEVISEHNGVVHRDHLGASAADARKVVIWDKGGHFEAVTATGDLHRR